MEATLCVFFLLPYAGAALTISSLCFQVAKSVSLRLYNELEAVQKKNSKLEWENEVLREKTQELEVAKQVLQSEVEKAREVKTLINHRSRTTLVTLFFPEERGSCVQIQALGPFYVNFSCYSYVCSFSLATSASYLSPGTLDSL